MPTSSPSAAIAITRFGLGGRPGELIAATADPIGFLTGQIRPAGADIPDNDGAGAYERLTAFFAYAEARKQLKAQIAADTLTPDAAKAEKRDDAAGIKAAIDADIVARMRLAATTPAAFRERWALFWANHFSVSGRGLEIEALIAPYEREAIRPHVFGKFRDMASAVLHHPAMLTYLDQSQSIGPNSPRGLRQDKGLNENLARETLELHTLGADAGYTQTDVTEFARALTGFTIGGRKDAEAAGRYRFEPTAHEPGTRTVLGRHYPQEDAGQAEAILRAAADDPRTARHVCGKIAAHFVADEPPPELVHTLERAWLAADGDLGAVAAALIRAPSAWTPAPAKFKTPYEFVVSCHRACGTAPDTIGAVKPVLLRLGQPAFAPPSPKGWPDEAGAWATSDGVIDRLAFASSLAQRSTVDDPLATGHAALGDRLGQPVMLAMQRAGSRAEALTLLFMSPEFQRR